MLANAAVTTMLPVIDMDRARAFYERCLGLTPGNFRPDGKFEYTVGGCTLALFPKAEGTKAEHTAISFKVPDIVASIAELKHAGVVFEDYDLPGFKTDHHVCVLGSEKAAWFKDTEGNYLCLHEDLASPAVDCCSLSRHRAGLATALIRQTAVAVTATAGGYGATADNVRGLFLVRFRIVDDGAGARC